MLQAVVVILFAFLAVSALAAGWVLLIKKGWPKQRKVSSEVRRRLAARAAISPIPYLSALLGASGFLIYVIAPEMIHGSPGPGSGWRTMIFIVSVALSYSYLAGGLRRD